MKKFIFRPASCADLLSVHVINNICLPVVYSIIEFFAIFFYYNIVVVEYLSKNSAVLIGYIIYEKNDPENISIISLAVLPNFRKQKIGTKLLAYIDNTCIKENIKNIYLHVHVKNIIAINFYLKNNFTNIKTVKDYYKGSIPEIKEPDYFDAFLFHKKIIKENSNDK